MEGLNKPQYADSLERITNSLESIDHSLKLIVTPRNLDSLSAYSAAERMAELLEKHDSHDVIIESVENLRENNTMYRAVCSRCGAESSWLPYVGLAKSNLNRYACEVKRCKQ